MRHTFLTVPSWAKSPIIGKAYKAFTDEQIILDKEDIKSFFYKRIISYKNRKYSLFSNTLIDVMQSLDALKFVRCRPGELNINSKLSNKDGIEIFTRANNGDDKKELAKEFSISEDTVQDIAALRTRASITMNWINGIPDPDKGKIIKPLNGKKLSPSIANLIRKDKKFGMTSKSLTKKYCVHLRTIQKIIANKMYPENQTETK